ncbi:glycine/betaine/sarcosine/D-proline family reductase selenoprotein B [Clostridium sp. MSJ-4]|uniref:Glycine/betaine/sarcosine/D-proline family reductase selenoprotein B n=1 Tax=Clostridium simiarum TaxID=2841506 RepID=A0ABS6F178_9CLOT|nr:glycine/betaine/sarcosine/D-proline family reductase selenoprotein B [Clostridium simiarum]MBU5592008.1 glycine/betaine/sarcosine/D-proline family reductase selenoprotein B [Clostridium simiarum]
MIKVVQFLNQVQAGFGSDEKMNITPEYQKGACGPGMLLKNTMMRYGADIVGTIICGDNYFLENKEEVIKEILQMIKEVNPDVVLCGPALNYKRYGECSGYLVEAVEKELNIPAFAAMAKDSTGTELFRKKIYIIETPGRGGVGLNNSLRKISSFAAKLGRKEVIGTAEEEGYFKRE